MTSILSNDGGDTDVEFGAVLDRAAGDDRAAIDELVSEFEPGMLHFARSRGATDPEGMVNGALSDALTNLPTFRGRDRRAFRAYLYQILRRRVADQYRKAYNQPKTVSGLDDDLVSGLVDHDASAFDERLADRELVEEILEQLTDEQREVLEMRVLTGLSIRETATRTGRTEGAVKSMQRRALVSLRSLAIAIAVIALGYFGIRALISAGGDVVLVDNTPAGTGAAEEEQSSRPVLEAEVPEPTSTLDGPSTDDADSGADTDSRAETETSTEDRASVDSDGAPAGGDGAGGDGAVPGGPPESGGSEQSGQNGGTAPDPTDSGPAEGSAANGTAEQIDPAFPVAQFQPVPAAPCSIVTDGTPEPGEVAFVTYHFNGPYDIFKGTSIDIIGPSSESALLPGKASPDRVWDGRRFPFVIGGNMFPDGAFTVRSFLADRGLKVTCPLDDSEVTTAPCTVTTDGPPERGDTATVLYRTPGQFWTLDGQATYIIGSGDESAMKSGGDATFRAKVERNFVIDGSMFRDGEFEVRTAFGAGAGAGAGAGYALCEVT
ncbi:MAG: RNA polymerase sigma factor [Actinomycetota bacterium]